MIICKCVVISIASMRNKWFLHIIVTFCLIASSAGAQGWRWWPLGITHDKVKGDTLYYTAEMLGVASSGT